MNNTQNQLRIDSNVLKAITDAIVENQDHTETLHGSKQSITVPKGTFKRIHNDCAHGEGYHQAMSTIEHTIYKMKNENKSDTEIINKILSMTKNTKNILNKETF